MLVGDDMVPCASRARKTKLFQDYVCTIDSGMPMTFLTEIPVEVSINFIASPMHYQSGYGGFVPSI